MSRSEGSVLGTSTVTRLVWSQFYRVLVRLRSYAWEKLPGETPGLVTQLQASTVCS